MLKGDLAPKKCNNDYVEIDGSRTACTREYNHPGACYWPQLPEWRRRAMQAVRNRGYVADKPL